MKAPAKKDSLAKLKSEILKLKRRAYVAEKARFERIKRRNSGVRASQDLLAAGVAHEFNNILGAIDGHAEWALESLKSEDMKEALKVIRTGCLRSLQITRALQGIGQVREESKSLVKLSKIFENLKSLVLPELKKSRIELELSAGTSQVYVDQDELLQVLVNLVQNSRDALLESSQKSPLIEVRSTNSRSGVVIRLSDNGDGIPDSFATFIFQPFFTTKGVMRSVGSAQQPAQSAAGTPKGALKSSPKGGVGLGLYLARNMVERQGGTLNLKQSSKKGACFEIVLPLVKGR